MAYLVDSTGTVGIFLTINVGVNSHRAIWRISDGTGVSCLSGGIGMDGCLDLLAAGLFKGSAQIVDLHKCTSNSLHHKAPVERLAEVLRW